MMEQIQVDGDERVLLNRQTDSCPICDTQLKNVLFTWNIPHGEAKASCCGADYQLQDYYVEDPSEEREILLQKLREPDTILIQVQGDWFKPLRKAMKELGVRRLTKDVVDLAEKKLTADMVVKI